MRLRSFVTVARFMFMARITFHFYVESLAVFSRLPAAFDRHFGLADANLNVRCFSTLLLSVLLLAANGRFLGKHTPTTG